MLTGFVENKTLVIASIFVVGGLLIFVNLGGLDIYALDEAKNAGCAREMLEKRDLIIPTFNYELRTDKPPLHYYFMMLSYKIFGVSPFSARFFSALLGLLTVLCTYLFTSKHLGKQVGFLAAFVLLSSTHWAVQFHLAVPDPYLVFFLTSGLFLFFEGHSEKRRWKLILGYVCFGLGALVKGPVAIGLPGLSIVLYLLISRQFNFKNTFQGYPILGVFIMLAVSVPWYWAVNEATDGEWIQGFFFKHNFGRFSGAMEGHGGIFLITLLYVFVGMLPFSIFVFPAARRFWKERKSLPKSVLFVLATAFIIVAFFAISRTKLPNYTVPAYPFLAIIISYYLHTWLLKGRSQVVFWIYLFICLLFPVGAYFGLGLDPYLEHLNYLAIGLILLPAGAILALIWAKKGQISKSIFAVGISFMLTAFIFMGWAFPILDRENPMQVIVPQLDKELPVIGYQLFNPSFVFYLQKEVPRQQNLEELQSSMQRLKHGYIVTRTQYEELENLPDLKIVAKQKDLFERPTTIVYEFSIEN